ncbi:hypothetical protein [Lentzea sp. NPDC060358]|uniref:hypothetical protein n=1 Tax=Lentzea sp. NPDC060358 TaxID=3347103 RepID=UPI0036585FC0
MPEQTTLSIKVSAAPHVVRGLYAVALEHLGKPSAHPAPRGGGGTTNSISGPVHGTVLQIGNVHGNVNPNR